MILWLTGSALAQQACIEPLSRIQLGAAIGDIGDALEVSDLLDAQAGIDDLRDKLPCLDEVLDQHLFALFARYNAVVYFYGQDEEEASRWGVASRLAEPDLGWDEVVFPATHPVRRVVGQADVPPLVKLANNGLAAPRGGGVFVNGELRVRPEAYEDIPGLVQVFDRSGRLVEAWWQEGNRYPDRILTDDPGDLAPPAWLGSDRPTDRVAGAPPPRPSKPPKSGGGGKLPLAPIGVSLALAAVSGASYLVADNYAGQLGDATSVDELTRTRTRANLLVVASGVSLAGAVGVGVGGVLLSGSF